MQGRTDRGDRLAGHRAADALRAAWCTSGPRCAGRRDRDHQTINNIIASERLYRSGIAAFPIVIVMAVVVVWALYVLLRPIDRTLALLVGWLRLVYASVFGYALVNLLDVAQLVGGAEQSGHARGRPTPVPSARRLAARAAPILRPGLYFCQYLTKALRSLAVWPRRIGSPGAKLSGQAGKSCPCVRTSCRTRGIARSVENRSRSSSRRRRTPIEVPRLSTKPPPKRPHLVGTSNAASP